MIHGLLGDGIGLGICRAVYSAAEELFDEQLALFGIKQHTKSQLGERRCRDLSHRAHASSDACATQSRRAVRYEICPDWHPKPHP